MPLLISLGRDLPELNLGEHEFVEVRYDSLVDPEGKMLARHRDNRWIAETGKHYVRLSILGPLTAHSPREQTTRLGPYEKLSMFNGCCYVEDRVFAFTDLQQRDWYVMNAGQHWPGIRVAFHRTGP